MGSNQPHPLQKFEPPSYGTLMMGQEEYTPAHQNIYKIE